ncbi:MAG TPA: CoA transferase [Hyphomicrobiaceae bacterium]|nr:CoA transferase [Hyphomicrobiaceae bacterium]
MKKPLAHVRIADFTQFLSGPFCTLVLADLGAEVIKIEPPSGDPSRIVPPHFVGGDSAYYLAVNRNKRSIGLDLRTEQGVALARDLILACDIVVENFRPGVMARLGLDRKALMVERPELVWCSLSGYGQAGPYSNEPAYDMIVQARSGGMSLTGMPDGPAVRSGLPIGDLVAGLYCAIAVLAALERRRRSGEGAYIDIGMLDCQIALLTYQAAYHLISGEVPGRQGRAHDSVPTYNCFSTRDGGEIAVTAITERMWQGLVRVLGLEDLLSDPRFATNIERNANRAELMPLLERAFARFDARDLESKLIAVGVPAARINSVAEALADPQVRERRMVLTLNADGERRVSVAGNPIKVEGVGESHAYPESLGESSRSILAEVLGLDTQRIDALIAAGTVVIGPRVERGKAKADG